jgi:hypothetical protein
VEIFVVGFLASLVACSLLVTAGEETHAAVAFGMVTGSAVEQALNCVRQ